MLWQVSNVFYVSKGRCLVKKFFGRVGCAAAFVVTLVSSAIAGQPSWSNMSQSGRNQAIANQARSYSSGQNVGVQCKPWVQNVVRDASRGMSYPPQNASNGYQWQNGGSGSSYSQPHYIPYREPIYGASSGDIVQMMWQNRNGTSYPHTAIVTGRYNGGMNWTDSNWYGNNSVNTHNVSYDDFRRATNGRYSVYQMR